MSTAVLLKRTLKFTGQLYHNFPLLQLVIGNFSLKLGQFRGILHPENLQFPSLYLIHTTAVHRRDIEQDHSRTTRTQPSTTWSKSVFPLSGALPVLINLGRFWICFDITGFLHEMDETGRSMLAVQFRVRASQTVFTVKPLVLSAEVAGLALGMFFAFTQNTPQCQLNRKPDLS